MKRLKNLLGAMDANTSTYREMYDGDMAVVISPNLPPDSDYDNCYFYRDEIAFTIEHTHKMAQDRPTVTIAIPVEMLGITVCTASTADFCLRELAPYIDELNADLYNRARSDVENGCYYLYRPGGEVLVRNSAYFADCPQKDYVNGGGITVYRLNDGIERPHRKCLCIRMMVQLPRKRLKKAIRMLTRDLPYAVDAFIADFSAERLSAAIDLAAKQTAIREWLKTSDCCAFIANGSILPRSKGTDLPMESAVPFKSTPHDEIEVCGIRGMGIRRGATVITGGGYSGKSTLLDAISAGIYDHVRGDGRELCITDGTAVTISAEDGRSIKSVNISPFIKWLPSGDTRDFSTDRASGSTSQAANIMEAVDCGAKLLLIDEDRSATNFMIRDRMMKSLIEKEPITPFTDRVNELYESKGVSTILVIGGSGEYLSVADRVYMMDDFEIHDVTQKSKSICRENGVAPDIPPLTTWSQDRTIHAAAFTAYPEGSGTERLEVSEMGFVIIGRETVDIRGLHDIITRGQLDAIGFMLRWIMLRNTDEILDLDGWLDKLDAEIEREGLDTVYSEFFTTTERFLDLPRRCEIKAVVSRMRKLDVSGNII